MLCFRKILVAEKFMDKREERGSIKVFRRNFFVSQYRKTSQRNPSMLCFRKVLVARKLMDKREGEV